MQMTQEAAGALVARQKAYLSGGDFSSYAARRAALEALREEIVSRRSRIEGALQADLGKSPQESYVTEIGFVLAEIRYALRHLKGWMKPERKRMPLSLFFSRGKVRREPYGSVLIVGAFNYPFQLLLAPLVSALAAGNAAVLSPSEYAPHTAAAVRELLLAVFPEELVFCAGGGAEENAVLFSCAFDKIFFTGSGQVGRTVLRAAAEGLVPVTLELGGKSPVIVGESADLSAACERIAWGKFLNAGQTCVAPDYAFVHRSRMGEFLFGMKEAVTRFYGKDARESADYGRIVSVQHAARLAALLARDNAYAVLGGGADPEARYVAPTLLCPPSPEQCACMEEEIFGPVLPVFVFDDPEEPIAYINAHDAPLALYLFTQDKREAESVLSRTRSGGACINDTISHLAAPTLPFGGVGASGMGSYHGKYGFLCFSHERAVLTRSAKVRLPFAYPPYSRKKMSVIEKFLR